MWRFLPYANSLDTMERLIYTRGETTSGVETTRGETSWGETTRGGSRKWFGGETSQILPNKVHLVIFTSEYTVMSPNIAHPLTLRTSPKDHVTFNQIKSILIFNIRLLLEREKQQKIITLCFHN